MSGMTQIYKKELFEDMKIDCNKCFGLCCIALNFSASDGFPEDKAAGIACLNLEDGYTCAVHKELKKEGYRGCLGYDCLGAGQKISQITFKGKDWKQYPESSGKMFSAFLVMRQLHEMMWYLAQALYFQTNQIIKVEISTLLESILRIAEADADSLLALNLEVYRNTVNKLLRITSALLRGESKEKAAKRSSGNLDYFGADLRKTNMKGADLRGACLIAANMNGVDFTGADLISADIRDANVKGANLANCIFLTQAQVNTAKGDNFTKLPFMIDRPRHW